MKRSEVLLVVGVVCLATLATALAAAQKPILATTPGATAVPPLRIGTFDSRIVALAYGNTEEFRSEMKAMYEELARAEREKDVEKANRMKILGPSRQHLAHQQVFSNGSIINIFPHFSKALPEIAAKRGVSIIVSKYELPYVAASVETVDVTDDIVALFSPNEQTRQWIEGAKKAEPIPLKDLVYDPEH